MSTKSKSILNKLYRQQRFLQIGVFSLVTVTIWVGFGLLRSQRTTSISKELKDLAIPLTPTIDTQLLEDINSKKQYSENELANFPIYKIIVSEDTRESNVVTIDVDESEFLDKVPSPSPSVLQQLNDSRTNSQTNSATSSANN